jgi:hypothetical protein
VPACGPSAANPTAAAAAAEAAAAPTSTGKKRKYGTAKAAAAAAATGASEAASKKQKVQKPPPALSDGRPGMWLDEDEAGDESWVQLGDHVFMQVDAASKKNMRDPASFMSAAAAAAEDAGAAGSSKSSSNERSGKRSLSNKSSNSTRLVWLFRVERFEGDSVFGRFYQNAARDLAQTLQLQRKTQELFSDRISSILHVLQPSDSSSSMALETLTKVEAEWLQEVQAGLCC